MIWTIAGQGPDVRDTEMTDETERHKSPASAESREERLSAALRENLRRRKAQARNRKSDRPTDAPNNANESS